MLLVFPLASCSQAGEEVSSAKLRDVDKNTFFTLSREKHYCSMPVPDDVLSKVCKLTGADHNSAVIFVNKGRVIQFYKAGQLIPDEQVKSVGAG